MPDKRWSRIGRSVLVLGIVVVAALAARSARAQLAPRDQQDPNLVFLGGERQDLLLVWSEDRGSGHRIYAKRVRSNGIPVGGASGGEWEATRNESSGGAKPAIAKGDQRWPSIIPGLLVYSERVPGAADYDIYAQRLFDNGRANGTPMLIAGGPGDQRYPDVLQVSRGAQGSEYLIVWSEDTKDLGDVMGIRVDYALRRSRGPAFPIAQGPGTAEDPAIVRDLADEDNYLVLYTDDRAGNKDIYGVRLVASGLPRGGPTGGPFPVIQTPDDDYAPEIVSSYRELVLGPTPTPTPRGRPPTVGRRTTNSLLLWTVDDVNEGPNVRGQRLSINGWPIGPSLMIAGGSGRQAWPAAALVSIEAGPGQTAERDEWLAVWCDDALGTLDVTSAPVDVNGRIRQIERILASD